MGFLSRRSCLALLVLVLLSHAALTLHATTHIPVDPTKCEYCAGHANPAHALVAPQCDLPRVVAAPTDFSHTASAPCLVRPPLYRERAPPVVV